MDLAGILLGLTPCWFGYSAYRGWSVLLLARRPRWRSFAGEPLLAHWTQTSSRAARRGFGQFFPLF